MIRFLLSLMILAVWSLHCGDSGRLLADGSADSPKPVSKKTNAPASDIVSNFESNTLEGWQPRIGNETVTVTSVDRHTGSYSLLTTGRQNAYDGCKINVTNSMVAGSEYRVSVWVKIAAGSPTSTIKVSLQRQLGSTLTYHPVVSKEVNSQSWARLTTVFDYSLPHDNLWLYVESTSGTASFYIDDFELEHLPPPKIQTEIPSLRDELAPHFKIGAAVWQGDLAGAHSQLLKKHFDTLTAEDAMKWGPIHPTESTYNFAPADAIVNFAKTNGMQVRGHALVWHEQVPDWLFRDQNGNPMTPTQQNKALLLKRLDDHIRAVVTHFGSDITAWDVVNEVIDHGQPDGFRRNMWFQICGPEYIDRAFLAARAAAPNAKLYINDYQTTVPAKRSHLLNLIQNLRSRGIPVDGIGHQLHSDIESPTAAEVIETVNLFSAIPGIDNQITEMDVSIYDNDHQMYEVIPPSVLLKQGYRYRDLFNAFRQLDGKISSVTFWGKADDHTWLSYYPIERLNAPLPFDDRLQAKPAFWGIVEPNKLKIEISGRVISSDGRGLRGATVTLTGSGSPVTTVTSSLGYYTFAGVSPFEPYTVSVSSKRYRFAPRTLAPSGNLAGIDFVGVE